MRAIYFDRNIFKIILTQIMGSFWKQVFYSRISPVSFGNMVEAPLPGPGWVRVKNRLAGICGSDLSLFFVEVNAKLARAALPGLSRVFLGHEIVGDIVEAGPKVTSLTPGDRVVLQKLLPSCFNKGIEPKCRHCREGNYSICENVSEEGGPNSIGGGWSDYLVAHEGQLVRLPDAISDEEAVLIEPTAVAVHAVLLRKPHASDKVLIVGGGVIGLLILHVLKQLQPDCEVSIITRYGFQREQAKRLGADHIIFEKDTYSQVALLTKSKLYSGMFNNRMIIGGFDVVFDCVGKGDSIQDSLRWTRAGGIVVLVGIDYSLSKFDCSPVVFQEIQIIGSYCHGMESWGGEQISSFDLVIRLLKEKKLKLDGLITHRFDLDDYKEAIKTVVDKGRSKALKGVFVFK